MDRTGIRRSAIPLIVLVATGLSSLADAQPLSKENFHEYLEALESVDADALRNRFYHEDFTIQLGDQAMDVAALIEYEESLKSLVDFHFEINQIVGDESGIAIDAIETLDVERDGDVPNIGRARAGERWQLHLNVFYGLTDGKISTISANILSVEKLE